MRTMRTMTKWTLMAGGLFVGTYGCRQVMGWEEATYWGDQGGAGGAGGGEAGSAGKGGSGGLAGAGGGGMGGAGGMAGAGGGGMGGMGGMPECVTPMDCPAQPNASLTCVDGKCGFTCNTGFGDCTVAAGCETNLNNNKTHCGMCGNTCAAYCTGTTCNDPVSIAGGYHHHCAVMTNGDVYCWGRNEKGELGDGTLASKSVPTKVKGLPGPAVQVDGGASATMADYTPKTCAVLVNGDLYCWGGLDVMLKPLPPTKVNGLSNVKEVSVGDAHLCAVTKTGTLFCWGGNVAGQVGNGGTSFVPTPVQIPIPASRISAGTQHTCASLSDGSLKCWGDNADGQLGIGNKVSSSSPALVTGIGGVSDVACGNSFTCAVAAGSLYCWGANQVGQLGTGGIADSTIPKLLNLSGAQSVDAGYNFSGAILSGAVKTWGQNSSGQLGNGTTNIAYSPVTTNITNGVMLRLSLVSGCALSSDGNVRCWGANAYGQLGNGGIQQSLVPTPVVWQ